MSDEQYVQAVGDLLPGVQAPAVPTPGRNPYEFIDSPGKLPVTGALTPLLRTSAKMAAQQAVTKVEQLAPCASGEDPKLCAGSFVDSLVSRAFRRPLLEHERARFLALFELGARQTYADGIRLMLEATLQSGSFLYRVELGGGAPGTVAERRTLSPHELASALSFFLLGSLPDVALWAKAVDGSLAQPEALEAEVERLLSLPKVQDNLTRIFVRWLKLERILVSERATSEFPDFGALRQPMLDESRRFFSRLIRSGGTLADVFTSRTAELDPALAAFYGVPVASSDGVVTVELPAEQRAGVLTHASLLGSIKASNRSVHRGLFVFREMLCGVIPPPPPSIDTNPPSAEIDTEREFAQYRASQGTCAACHGFFDGIGLSYEKHDALGRYQALDAGGAVLDAAAEVSLDGARVPVTGVTELAELMSRSPEVQSCVSRQLLGYALGTSATRECASGVSQRVAARGGSLVELFRAIALDPYFALREVQP